MGSQVELTEIGAMSYRGQTEKSRHDPYDFHPNRDKNGLWKENPQESKCIGIFGLDYYISEKELEKKCRKYGRVERCLMPWNHKEKRNKGFAFVTFERLREAVAAVDGLNGTKIEDNVVRVDYSFTKHGKYEDTGKRKSKREVPHNIMHKIRMKRLKLK